MIFSNFFNTTKENGRKLESYKQKALTQDQQIFAYFQSGVFTTLSASKLERYMNCPITSIRRSLHNLEREGKIFRPGKKVIGKYGRYEYVYELF